MVDIGIDIKEYTKITNKDNKNIKLFQFLLTSKIINDPYLYKKYIIKNNINIIIHSSYIINLSRNWNETNWWILYFIKEIKVASILNSSKIIIHTGKKKELIISQAINNMYSALLYIHSQTFKEKNVKILLETPSGQGSETLHNIEDFCYFMKKFYTQNNIHIKNRFYICIDTCHLYAAGYNISNIKEFKRIINIIDKIIGINKIKLIHINDSKKELGSKIDRHSNFHNGMIGKKNIIKIFNFIKKLNIQMIIETPYPEIYKDYKILEKYNI